MRVSLAGLIGVVVVGSACSGERAHGLYHLSSAPPPSCARPVRLVRGEAAIDDSYRELASISATCGDVAPTDCENTLLARACELGADAVWIKNTSYVGPKRHPRLTEEGVAVAFTSAPPAQPSN